MTFLLMSCLAWEELATVSAICGFSLLSFTLLDMTTFFEMFKVDSHHKYPHYKYIIINTNNK